LETLEGTQPRTSTPTGSLQGRGPGLSQAEAILATWVPRWPMCSHRARDPPDHTGPGGMEAQGLQYVGDGNVAPETRD
jgi:hypothetical protein